jgi:NADH dehydrogenase/NADH:ubiquinone oxidoreductase subunit G
MVTVTINGQEIQAPEDATVLEVARDNGIYIPTLCYHEALGRSGVCRLCIVEVSGSIRPSLRISCAQPVQEGLVVETESERVQNNRRMLFELLLARSPNAQNLREMAARYGVYESRFYAGESEDRCVRCGRCVRTCRDRIGVYALCFAHRGYDRKVTSEFEELSRYCIGCGACTQVCPTGEIRMRDDGGIRTVFTHDVVIGKHELERCRSCGKFYAPKKFIEYVRRNSDLAMGIDAERGYCAECARLEYARQLAPELQQTEKRD